jgi:hypothetical protein
VPLRPAGHAVRQQMTGGCGGGHIVIGDEMGVHIDQALRTGVLVHSDFLSAALLGGKPVWSRF